ncbi:MAG: epoxyqueuosine reductase [Firmicutes bacterium]|nr:epoxyqueuosine reductase [Bacillota bacterium]MCL5040106.1 epoxyqueuosine reductase [Bacillota bacterium]
MQGAMLKEALREKGTVLGIALGVTTAEPFWELAEILEARRQAGSMADFEEKDLEKRYRPDLLLAGARSIIAVAVPYNALTVATGNVLRSLAGPDPEGKTSASGWLPTPWWPSPPISLHALGRDYHVVVREKLEQLVAWLSDERKEEFNFHLQADTGPLVEREVARRAGLGWIGPNASLFVPGFGSLVYLGLLLTTLEIPPDEPGQVWSREGGQLRLAMAELPAKADQAVADRGAVRAFPGDRQGLDCQGCGRCVEACPSGALEASYQLNPARCLSYWTQSRGFIPEGYRRILGGRLYGCDTCQLACPENITLLRERGLLNEERSAGTRPEEAQGRFSARRLVRGDQGEPVIEGPAPMPPTGAHPNSVRLRRSIDRVTGPDPAGEVVPEQRPGGLSNQDGEEEAWRRRLREEAFPSPLKILHLSNEEFRRCYGPTAVGWRGRKVLQRNALVSIGNSLARAPEHLIAREIFPFLSDPRAEIRGQAAWALAQMAQGGRASDRLIRMVLREAGERETDGRVQEEISQILKDLGEE